MAKKFWAKNYPHVGYICPEEWDCDKVWCFAFGGKVDAHKHVHTFGINYFFV